MQVFLNGALLQADEAKVSVFDRGFIYGDGLFESIRVANGTPFRWRQHMARLERGAAFLKIRLPFQTEQLCAASEQLILANQVTEGMLRIAVSRGVGPRGYSIRGADNATVVISTHELLRRPALWKAVVSPFRVPTGDPFSAFKTSNKLAQVMSKSLAEDQEADEALLLNTDGHVVEGISSNVFWIANRRLFTPALEAGLLPGVTREIVIGIAEQHGFTVKESKAEVLTLQQAQGIFFTVSSAGIVECAALEDTHIPQSEITGELKANYERLLKVETSRRAS